MSARALRVSLLIALFGLTTVGAHPHGPDTSVVLTGTLTKVNASAGAIELDAVERGRKTPANKLVFVSPKAQLRSGKRRITLTELMPGQRVRCVAQREDDRDGRLVASELRLLDER
jgi:hypothetical protein